MSERAYILPPWIRIWHWTNAALMLVLIASGVSLHFADPNLPLIRFDLARTIHNVAGLTLTAVYVIFVVVNFATGNWRNYLPSPVGFFKELNDQNAYVASGIFKGDPPPVVPTPERKFNVLQTVTYLLIMYGAMPLVILTGLAFFFPEFAPDKVFGMAGLWPIAVTHYVIGYLLTLFLLGHIYMGTMGSTFIAGFRMMITGWHEEKHAKNQSAESIGDGS